MVKKNKVKIRKTPFFVIAFFLFLTIVGTAVEEPGRVLEQALQVCLSCMGIG
jgi:hypothetical protein